MSDRSPRDRSSFRGMDWGSPPLSDLLADADLSVDCRIWAPSLDEPACDCPLDPHHRWNCPLTPIWAQTIRELDCNPWTVVTFAMRPISGLPMPDGWIDPDPWPSAPECACAMTESSMWSCAVHGTNCEEM